MKIKCVAYLLILCFTLSSCAQESKIITFEVSEASYKTTLNEAVSVKDGEIDFSIKRINESAKSRYEFMVKTLDYMDNYSKRYIDDLDSYLILGSQTFGNDKTHLYHFFKKGNNNQGISILVACPYDLDEKYKEEIFRVVKSAHF
jgi:hypothetical protein